MTLFSIFMYITLPFVITQCTNSYLATFLSTVYVLNGLTDSMDTKAFELVHVTICDHPPFKICARICYCLRSVHFHIPLFSTCPE